MGYDLHIVRTDHWMQAASAPITRQDVDSLITSDPELGWSTTSYVDMADDTGTVTRYYAIAWRGEPCFFWYRDQIECSNPDEAQTAKLVQMSRALNAYVVGDDGEIYPLEDEPEPTTLPYLTPLSTPTIRRLSLSHPGRFPSPRPIRTRSTRPAGVRSWTCPAGLTC